MHGRDLRGGNSVTVSSLLNGFVLFSASETASSVSITVLSEKKRPTFSKKSYDICFYYLAPTISYFRLFNSF